MTYQRQKVENRYIQQYILYLFLVFHFVAIKLKFEMWFFLETNRKEEGREELGLG